MPIDSAYFWTIVAGMAIGSFSIRGSFIFLSRWIKISDRTRELFSFIPAAILPALVMPLVFFHEGSSQWLMGKERLTVLFIAAVVCYYSRSMITTIFFGLSILFLINQFIP